jgi:hypothetical protein
MTRNMPRFYVGWFGIISAATVLQFYLAGYGAFGFSGLNGFTPHLVVGDLIGIAILIGIGLAFAARVPWRITGINGVLLVLMVIQAVLAHTGVQGISALHAVNGVLIFGLTIYLTREAWKVATNKENQPPRQEAVTSGQLR